jgi:hypothetical protein
MNLYWNPLNFASRKFVSVVIIGLYLEDCHCEEGSDEAIPPSCNRAPLEIASLRSQLTSLGASALVPHLGEWLIVSDFFGNLTYEESQTKGLASMKSNGEWTKLRR